MDWLFLWGVTQAVGFIFKPILEELAKDAAKDYVKDFFKSCLSKVLRLPEKEPLQIATGKAIAEFLRLIQQELEDADLDDITILQYHHSIEEFIKNKQVAEILGSTFTTDSIEIQTLKQIWKQLQSKTLPDEFNWERIIKRYRKKVKAIIQEIPELRDILDSQNLQQLADAVPVQPDFDLLKHQEGIRERYGNLNLESIDTTGCAYNALKLWKIFIPQNVRECEEYLPQVYEVPKEYFRQLQERGEIDEAVSREDLEQHRRLYSQQSIQSILEVVENPNFKYLVILGDPGSGKSTLLQYLALNWAEFPSKDLPDYPIPLLIELRTYNREKQEKQCQDFLEFFHCGNVICRLPQQELHSRLEQGKVLVLFDGLDEVFDPAQREEVITDIHRFTNDYPKITAIVTSRVIGYKAQRLKDAEFRHFMLQDMAQEGEADKFMNLFLAAECLLEVRSPSVLSEISQKLYTQLERLIQYEPLERLNGFYVYGDNDYQPVIEVRYKAVSTIASTWVDFPQTFLWLKNLIQNDDDYQVRKTAVNELATKWKDHSQTLPSLKRFTSDENIAVRYAAVQALATAFKDDPDTLTILKTRATTDDDSTVRGAAVVALATAFKDDPELFELFCDRAVNDPFERSQGQFSQFEDNPRQTALVAIFKNYPHHPQSLPLLRDRALNDPDEPLRKWAKKQLEKSGILQIISQRTS